jgi:hypothetical protein
MKNISSYTQIVKNNILSKYYIIASEEETC